jgi:hypothetical protein
MDDCFDDNPGWMLTLSWGQQGRQSMKNALSMAGGECHQARTVLGLAPLIDF